MVIDKHCNKSGDGFHNWNLDIDLNKVFCVYCGEFYSSDGQTEHKHVYIQNKLVGDGKVRCLHCDKEFEPRFNNEYSTKESVFFDENFVLGRKHFAFVIWFSFMAGFILGVVTSRLFWWLSSVGSIG